jgi:hypothetical protein
MRPSIKVMLNMNERRIDDSRGGAFADASGLDPIRERSNQAINRLTLNISLI